jgi:hypothetical protein
MRALVCVLLVFCALHVAQPAVAVGGMCATASFFNYQNEFFNSLCWIELELSCGQDPPPESSYPYVP